MLNDSNQTRPIIPRAIVGLVRFLSDILKDVAASLLVVTHLPLATAVTAGMLWYYEWPLFLSPVGGFIVLGVMLLFWYDS